ncbi:MAG: competence/damage-inducible protein A [Clostridiales bacterium]|nr:competence/damage-inducible protein A [Clostridiales bacterium]
MIAEILSVGTELLMGQIVNTNAKFISEHFPEADVYVYYHTVVGDNKIRLKECLNIALSRADVIITTGGLGPTQDDLTKEIISKTVGKEMVVNEKILNGINEFFTNKGRKMTKNNAKQAYFPKGSMLITNEMGTAPGCLIEYHKKVIIMLPGPPREMQPMFMESILPYFKKTSSYKLHSVFIRLFGIGESAMESEISDLIETQTNPTIAPYAKSGEVTLRVTAKYDANVGSYEDVIKPTINEIKKRLGKYIYSYDNTDLKEVVFSLLLKKHLTVSFAESCTGGLLSKYLTDISGSSKVFNSSFITYSNESKITQLDVSPKVLKEHGEVSGETVIEMVKGLQNKTTADLVLAITGIAGPNGGTTNKPVGTVYLGLGYKKQILTKKLNLWGNRDRIRHVTCLHAFDFIRKTLLQGENA